MIQIWSCPVFLKIVASKRQAKSLKTTCEVVLSHLQAVHLESINNKNNSFTSIFKGFAKIPCDVSFNGIVKNLIIYFAETFRYFSHDQFIFLLLFSQQMFEQRFSRNTSQWLFQLIYILKQPPPQKKKKQTPKTLKSC